MPIIFSTISALRPDGGRMFFQAPDDALLSKVEDAVGKILGKHRPYRFHDANALPEGVKPVVLPFTR